MHGNVCQWCDDLVDGGRSRMIRGGFWGLPGQYCRAAYRLWGHPAGVSAALGLRVARVPSGA
jgi:formylglycine-generating enzyme required for sulfatase activity